MAFKQYTMMCLHRPPFAGASDAAAGGADGDADEEAPAKFTPEIKVDEEKWHVLFNNKARLHVRLPKGSGGGDWEGRGVGMVTLRQPKEGDSLGRACVMFSTEVVRLPGSGVESAAGRDGGEDGVMGGGVCGMLRVVATRESAAGAWEASCESVKE